MISTFFCFSVSSLLFLVPIDDFWPPDTVFDSLSAEILSGNFRPPIENLHSNYHFFSIFTKKLNQEAVFAMKFHFLTKIRVEALKFWPTSHLDQIFCRNKKKFLKFLSKNEFFQNWKRDFVSTAFVMNQLNFDWFLNFLQSRSTFGTSTNNKKRQRKEFLIEFETFSWNKGEIWFENRNRYVKIFEKVSSFLLEKKWAVIEIRFLFETTLKEPLRCWSATEDEPLEPKTRKNNSNTERMFKQLYFDELRKRLWFGKKVN